MALSVEPDTSLPANEGSAASRGPGVVLFATTIFVSAFLLFQVQPLIGRFVLPWFGGAAGVWTTALLFFQVTLLIGYLYAHLVVDRLPLRRQVTLHAVLVGLAAATLPIIPGETLKPDGAGDPTIGILVLLALTVGLPYLVLSTTGPLLQAWFAAGHPGRSPYRLYALSNAGSLLALLSYPFAVERFFPLRGQAWAWSIGFVGFAALVGVIILQIYRRMPEAASSPSAVQGGIRPSWSIQWLWIALPAIASLLLIAVTAQLTTNISPIPLLWIVPLAIYLLSFILTFDSSRWYRRSVFGPAVAASLAVTALSLTGFLSLSLLVGAIVYSVMLFTVTMSLHGELVMLKPDPGHLTRFYLMIAVGGALGGVFTGVVAPIVFDGLWELHLGLVAAAALLVGVRYRTGDPPRLSRPTLVLSVFTLLVMLGVVVLGERADVVAAERSFYGVLRVREYSADDPNQHRLTLIHGSIIHGLQFVDPERADWKVSYYSEDSGIGVAIAAMRNGDPLRMGMVGLGTGVIAAYAEPADELVFYEIDPSVVDFADAYFTYLGDARRRDASVDVLLGDARLVLERQLAMGEPQGFDILVVDAFSGDAIPVHLLTQEAFALYRSHLAPGGVVAFHISNRYLDLSPVVRGLAEANGMEALAVAGMADDDRGVLSSDWVLVTADADFASIPVAEEAIEPWTSDDRLPLLWTDDYSNILSVLR